MTVSEIDGALVVEGGAQQAVALLHGANRDTRGYVVGQLAGQAGGHGRGLGQRRVRGAVPALGDRRGAQAEGDTEAVWQRHAGGGEIAPLRKAGETRRYGQLV